MHLVVFLSNFQSPSGEQASGRLQSISNFFNNMRNNERRDRRKQRLRPRSGSDSPVISSSRTTPQSVCSNSTPIGKNTPDIPLHLPPITNSSGLLNANSNRIEESGSRASSRNNTLQKAGAGSNLPKRDITPDVPRHKGKTKSVEQL